MVGRNTVSSDQLRSYIDRLERLREDKKQISDDEASVMAEAKSNGFVPATIRAVLKRRAMKPHDAQEAEALFDMYMHALGMSAEPPLFRFAGLGAIDTTARDQVIERMSEFVPASGLGHIVVNMGGKQVRLTRDKAGAVQVEEVREQPRTLDEPGKQPPSNRRPRREPAEVPDVDDAGAETLGEEYARANRPVIDNPFPFGDARRARFDAGWRRASGSDGMGPDEDD